MSETIKIRCNGYPHSLDARVAEALNLKEDDMVCSRGPHGLYAIQRMEAFYLAGYSQGAQDFMCDVMQGGVLKRKGKY